LDGAHRICRPESPDPSRGTGGIGLCGEFGIEEPIGWDEAAPGEHFPKLGVGLLQKREDSRYRFHHKHRVEPFPMDIETTATAVRFRVAPIPCRGYAAELEKDVSLQDTSLRVSYRLKNVGRKRLATTEYAHNFVAVNDAAFTPGAYQLRLAQPLSVAVPAPWVATGAEIEWAETIRGGSYCRDSSPAAARINGWSLLHRKSGVKISEQVDFAPSRVALFGTEFVISPELFIAINLAPGEELRWSRVWRFEAPA
jgi:hypothetical protein